MRALPDGLRVRRAEPSDAATAADTWLRSRHASVPAIPAPVHTDDEVRAWFRDVLLPAREVWVVEPTGARGTGEPFDDLAAVLVLEDGWIDQLHVDPAWFGRGIGSVLVEHAQARQPGGLDLWTFARNVGARRFYERHGFVAVDATDDANEEGEPDVRYRWQATADLGAPGQGYRPMPVALGTDRLTLRVRGPEDAAWSLELLDERGDGVTRTHADVQARIEAQAEEAVANRFGFLTIRRRDTGEAIGCTGLLIGRSTVEEPELAYELLRRHHGHGFATEAAGAVLAAAFATGRDRIWATVRPSNRPSLRVLDTLGFDRVRSTVDDDGEVVWLACTR